MKLHIEPASGPTQCCWNCRLSSENISSTNLHGSGNLVSHFNFSQYRKFIKQVYITCDSNLSSQNDFITVSLSNISSVVLVIFFRLNSLINSIKF